MEYFQTKNTFLGIFLRAFEWKMLEYFRAISKILRPFGILYGYLEYFVVIWHNFHNFGLMFQEKTGNPDRKYRCLSNKLLLKS
jgi:hypothetical protein